VEAWARERVRRALDAGAVGRALVENGRPVGLAVLEPQAWESRYFGRRFGALAVWRVPAGDAAAGRGARLLEALLAGEPYDTVAATVEAADVEATWALTAAGFRLLDTKMTYALDLRGAAAPAADAPGVDVGGAAPAERDALVALAREVFAGYRSRFTADPALPAAARAEFYATWMRNSFEGFADAVLVARLGGQPAGFCTLKRGGLGGVRYARIDLVGTAPAARRQGVFDALVAETARRARPDAGALVLVSKLDNYPVQAALARLGFRLVSAEHALHRTRPAEGGA
jgi:ribosomal protein S18 acetylase RimI-like enzyme